MHAPHELTTSEVMRWWSWEPITIALLAISAILYAIGTARLRWRTGNPACPDRRDRLSSTRFWQLLAFAAGLLAHVIALISSLVALGAILFSAHIAQHAMQITVE